MLEEYVPVGPITTVEFDTECGGVVSTPIPEDVPKPPDTVGNGPVPVRESVLVAVTEEVELKIGYGTLLEGKDNVPEADACKETPVLNGMLDD